MRALHHPIDYAIDQQPGLEMQYRPIYNLSEVELGTFMAYTETILSIGFSQVSVSSAAALILFAKKQDSGLWLCVDSLVLNSATI